MFNTLNHTTALYETSYEVVPAHRTGHCDCIHKFKLPAVLMMDNAAAEVFTNNTANKTRLKHIDCRQEWVKMLRNKALIRPVHVPSEDNLADIFTKILSRTVFINLRNRMMHTKQATA